MATKVKNHLQNDNLDPRDGGLIRVEGAVEHNLKSLNVTIERGKITVITGVSGSGKSSLAFDTILAEAQRRFFYTLSHYSRQFLDLGARPAVRSIGGLSPAISLAQNETQPSRRASVGTLTDTAELLAIMFARFGEQRCPRHDLPTASQGREAMVAHLMEHYQGKTMAICAPIAEAKKGVFRAQLTAFAEKGFLRAYIDGKTHTLTEAPDLVRDEKHTIKLIVDHVKVKEGAEARLQRSISTALEEGKGFVEYFVASAMGDLDLKSGGRFSSQGGCPVCGFSWPSFDARYFSANSLGRCKACNGFGVAGYGLSAEDDGKEEREASEDASEEAGIETPCESCLGTGLDKEYQAIKLSGQGVHDLHLMPLSELHDFILKLKTGSFASRQNQAFLRVADELTSALKRICAMGLGYLNLGRRVRTLSGGESQRLKLAGILSESLRGVMYILDEPSQGLHPSELELLWANLEHLKAEGNTIIIVDHDEALMARADTIIDLGPGGGAAGGNLIAKFTPESAGLYRDTSVTARHLAERASPTLAATPPKSMGDFLEIRGLKLHNLKIDRVRFPLGAMTVVSGVSGAGKSSLAIGTLFANAAEAVAHLAFKRSAPSKPRPGPRHCLSTLGFEKLTQVSLIDRRPVAKSSVSMPASYLDVFGEIRDLFAQLPEAQVAGLTARSFSLNAADGGRCEECRGRGEVTLSMRFLADARVRCSVCHGRRYRPIIEDIRYMGKSIADVLELTLGEALELFKNHRRISHRLRPASDLGLGYLKLGQPSASLSGGEAQRLKIVPFLSKRFDGGALLILDEPTTGLHFEDVQRLIQQLRRLTELGATVVLVEHNRDLLLAADWLIDLGPGAASLGGGLVYEGAPSGLKKASASITGRYL